MAGCGCEMQAIQNRQQRKTLQLVLAINALMFVFEASIGWWAQSTGLIADSLDMFADAAVYGISLYAVGKSCDAKQRAARLSGYGQIALALLALGDVLRRVFQGSEPVSLLMMGVGLVALLANATCLTLISKHRQDGAHMRAAHIFSKNDVIANLGVILAGALVWWQHSPYPDLIIGSVIALIVLRGGLSILRGDDDDD
ncbi:MAG: hypothetical protein RL210_441 [Pseudomonadota bacterium]|jgi:Co/Zn/Cd efflux system component